jgi:hypothetical protein
VKGVGGKRLEGLLFETFVFEEKLESDTWIFYVTRPRENVLICATQHEYLKEVLDRMAGTNEASFLEILKQRDEWKFVDRGASPVWAIRIFRPENAHNGSCFPPESW